MSSAELPERTRRRHADELRKAATFLDCGHHQVAREIVADVAERPGNAIRAAERESRMAATREPWPGR